MEPPVAPVVPPASVLPANTDICPPSNVLPSPTLIVISPPSPLDAVPVPIDIDPDPPQDVVPVLNINSPLTPFVPAFNVRILMVPLDLSKLYPLRIEIDPPVESSVATVLPANKNTCPPSNVLPSPTLIIMSPPSPLHALPVPIDIDPDPPHVVVPVLNINSPLTPFAPAFNVRIIIEPLLLSVLNPLRIDMEPPVAPVSPLASVLPANTDICPSNVHHISPPSTCIPVPIDIDPDPPHVVVPVLNINSPLTPFAPAFNVRIIIVPLLLSVLNPLRIDMEPPVAPVVPPASVLPANTDTCPPSNVLPSPTLIVISPPSPLDAVPVPIDIDPDPPQDVQY